MCDKREKIAYTVGARIRDFRIQKKMSQEALALDSDIHPAYLSQLERGEKCPTIETIYKICMGLKISMSELLDFSLEPAPTSNEAVNRITIALGKVSSDKAVKIAGIVEEIVDLEQNV
ncbi:MAG: helix-turn-helix domain-containing protein [Ruminococcus sp.]|nr:helix-turn-helix domain-containing protein [Ruminococcus sp.]